MASPITRSEIDKFRKYLRANEPYDKDDPILKEFDGEDMDPGRHKATIARDLLEAFGLDPYDDDDYGDIPE